MKKGLLAVLILILLTLAAGVAVVLFNLRQAETVVIPRDFNGKRAYEDVLFQVEKGPRTPGSNAHMEISGWIQKELDKAGWDVSVQTGTRMDQSIKNIIARQGSGEPWIILGAHYDSRLAADQDSDPAAQKQAVIGANDGASGVAVLLELARTLPKFENGQVWLVFFDAEDQGRLEGWDWILGSTYFVDKLEGNPDYAIIIDMIGDRDLNVYYERNSDPVLSEKIWDIAAELGYENQFIPEVKYAIHDDHIPFLKRGIPAVDIIDFDYEHWHTSADTADKVSSESLQIMGDVLTRLLEHELE